MLAIKTPQEGRKCSRLGQWGAGDGVEGRIGEEGGGGGGGMYCLFGGFWRSGCRICVDISKGVRARGGGGKRLPNVHLVRESGGRVSGCGFLQGSALSDKLRLPELPLKVVEVAS
jgi:hypothetical protein